MSKSFSPSQIEIGQKYVHPRHTAVYLGIGIQGVKKSGGVSIRKVLLIVKGDKKGYTVVHTPSGRRWWKEFKKKD